MQIALDLDGTLAHYDGWQGVEHIGAPITEMMTKVYQWLDEGHDITIFTARVSVESEAEEAARHIIQWLADNNLPPFPITCIKHKHFELFVDDRAKGVLKNCGVFL